MEKQVPHAMQPIAFDPDAGKIFATVEQSTENPPEDESSNQLQEKGDDQATDSHSVFFEQYIQRIVDSTTHLPEVRSRAAMSALGSVTADLAQSSDCGPRGFQVITNALMTLRTLFSAKNKTFEIYPFGSCVSFGSWDGSGDADFTLVHRPTLNKGITSESQMRHLLWESRHILETAGFGQKDVEMVFRTRVPLIHRVAPPAPTVNESGASASNEAHGLGYAAQDKYYSGPYYIVFRAEEPILSIRAEILSKIQSFWGSVVGELSQDPAAPILACFPDGVAAVRAYSIVRKTYLRQWAANEVKPEIFRINFDLVCRIEGIRNSWYLRRYLEQSPIVRAGGVFVKKWGKKSGVVDSRSGYLTSYAVIVMWIYYLLRTRRVAFVDPLSIPVYPPVNNTTISYIPILGSALCTPEATQQLHEELGEVIAGFFNFYTFEFDWEHEVVTLRHDVSASTGRSLVQTKEAMGWVLAREKREGNLGSRVHYRFCIEDPYEDNFNLGRHITSSKLANIKVQFALATDLISTLTAASPTPCSIDEGAMKRAFEQGLLTDVSTYASQFDPCCRQLLRMLLSEASCGTLTDAEIGDVIVSHNEKKTIIAALRKNPISHFFERTQNSPAIYPSIVRRVPRCKPLFFPLNPLTHMVYDRKNFTLSLCGAVHFGENEREILHRLDQALQVEPQLGCEEPLLFSDSALLQDTNAERGEEKPDQLHQASTSECVQQTRTDLVGSIFFCEILSQRVFLHSAQRDAFLEHTHRVESAIRALKRQKHVDPLDELSAVPQDGVDGCLRFDTPSEALRTLMDLARKSEPNDRSGDPLISPGPVVALDEALLERLVYSPEFVTISMGGCDPDGQVSDSGCGRCSVSAGPFFAKVHAAWGNVWSLPSATKSSDPHVRKARSGKTHSKASATASNYSPQPHALKVSKSSTCKIETCDACGKTQSTVFATSNPTIDWGWYCNKCWEDYEQGH